MDCLQQSKNCLVGVLSLVVFEWHMHNGTKLKKNVQMIAMGSML
jgi:hypothetical protein